MHGARESIFDLIMMDGELDELHVREKGGVRKTTECLVEGTRVPTR